MTEFAHFMRRTANDPNPQSPENPEHGQLCMVINELGDSFSFGNDTVDAYSCLQYVWEAWNAEKKQWCSLRKMQSILDLGKQDLLERWEEG